MDWRVRRISKELKKYDKKLYAIRTREGMIQIFREGQRIQDSCYDEQSVDSYILRPFPQFILALTHNWRVTGRPVDWGIEPLMKQMMSMDTWKEDRMYEKLCENREREVEIKKQSEKNEMRALIADSREDFKKAANDLGI